MCKFAYLLHQIILAIKSFGAVDWISSLICINRHRSLAIVLLMDQMSCKFFVTPCSLIPDSCSLINFPDHINCISSSVLPFVSGTK